MKNISFESQGSNAYLVYAYSQEDVTDTYARGMLQENEIEGIISPSFVQRDDNRYLKYQVTSMISLSDLISQPVEKESLIAVVCSILKAADGLTEYMLSEENLLLDTDYVYFNLNTKEACLVYIPLDGFKNETTVKEFLLHVIVHCRYRTEEGVEYVAHMINAFNDPQIVNNDMLCKELENIENKLSKVFCEKKVVEKKEEINVQKITPVEEKESNIHPAVPPVPQVPVKTAVPKDGKKDDSAKESSLARLLSSGKKKEEKKKEEEIQNKKPAFVLFDRKGKEQPKGSSVAIPGFKVPGQEQKEEKKKENTEKKGLFGFDRKEKNNGDVAAVSGTSQKIYTAQEEKIQIASHERIQSFAGESNGSEHTVVFGGGESSGTVIIDAGTSGLDEMISAERTGRITCTRTGRNMIINKEVIHIGRDSGYVDFLISDNKAVSASHADIFMENGAYYLVDKNSSNHTYLNGTMLTPQKKYELTDKDSVLIANEEIVFTIG